MTNSGDLKVTANGDREIVMTRSFNAPRHLVFEALSKPELVKQWLLGPPGWSMPVCEIDFRIGGKYRYVWRHTDGKEMGMGGVYRDIVRPERIVNTEVFDESWYPGEAQGTTTIVEQNGKSVLTQTMRYETREARDGVLRSPMESGVAVSYNHLEQLLTSMAA
jgi:uncharacterized protein YndB with AHSA1/START domain